MKILNWLERVGAFILKNWRYVLLGICLTLFIIIEATFWPTIKGIAMLGTIWILYSLWIINHNVKL